MKILFIGCVESSYFLLESLLEAEFEVSGIITMKQSAFNSDFKSLEPLANKYGIACYYTENINDNPTFDFIQKSQPDVIYCFGWSRLIGDRILDYPKHGVVGFHPAELPNNRGRHPLIWALVLGLEKTASSFFIMDKGADTGDIISQKIVPIKYEDDARSLYQKILETAKEQVLTFTQEFIDGTITRISQSGKDGNEWRKRGKADGQVDWRMSSRGIYNLVRALTHPYVGAHFAYGERDIKIWKCEEADDSGLENIEPGKVIRIVSDTDYFVKANGGVIHVLESDPIILSEGDYLR